MHPQGDRDVRGLPKGRVLCRIVAFTEVVHAVAESSVCERSQGTMRAKQVFQNSQVPNDDVHRRRRVV